MGSACQMLWLRQSWSKTPTDLMATRLWETFTIFIASCYSHKIHCLLSVENGALGNGIIVNGL